jgi:hypothetical protein
LWSMSLTCRRLRRNPSPAFTTERRVSLSDCCRFRPLCLSFVFVHVVLALVILLSDEVTRHVECTQKPSDLLKWRPFCQWQTWFTRRTAPFHAAMKGSRGRRALLEAPHRGAQRRASRTREGEGEARGSR